MAADAAPETMRFREFADHLDRKPGYVTELRKAGRLVLTPDGKRVIVAESIALIEATRDPARAGVARRHAAERAAARAQAAAKSPAKPAAAAGTGAGEAGDDAEAPLTFVPEDPHTKRRAKALADKAEFERNKAERDELRELGQLLEAEDVTAMIADATTTLRTAMENLPGQIAPGLAAATTEEQVRVLLTEAIETRLADLARTFNQIGKGPE